MKNRRLLFEQACEPSFWKQLNPKLSVTDGGCFLDNRKIDLNQETIDSVRDSLKADGYFLINDLFDKKFMDLLALGVENIWKAGWPTAFAGMYDEYWELYYSLRHLFTGVLGPHYKQEPTFWCWYINTNNESKGWGHHRDRPGCKTILDDGMPASLSVWIPFTDATVLNGCMYVLPARHDPDYPSNLQSRHIENPQNIRALPANKGSVMGWSEALLHWGSRSSDQATHPRISISCTYQRDEISPIEIPLFDPKRPPTFEERLGLIGQNVLTLYRHDGLDPVMLEACRQLGNKLSPIQMTECFERDILEVDRRLSESILWTLQEEYFTGEGLNAWNHVPFYTTSRMSFCEVYADMCLAFMLDYQDKFDYTNPLYLVELGAGPGCFSYRFLNELLERKKGFKKLADLQIRYILTDFTANNVNQLMKKEKLQQLRTDGNLDFAVFRPEEDEVLNLLDSDKTIAKADLTNPLIVIANYVFDSIRQDAFRVSDGVLQETRITSFRDARNSDLSKPVSIEHVQTLERFFDIEGAYYGDPELDPILEHYRTTLEEASVIFPIGALRSLSTLRRLSNNRLIIFAADKGFTSTESRQIKGFWKQEFSTHGSFSFDVNFDAISRYFDSAGGTLLMEPGDHEGLCTTSGIILQGESPDNLEHLNHYFKHTIKKKDPVNSQFNIEELIANACAANAYERSWLTIFLSIVQTYNFEPVIFSIAFNKTSAKLLNELARTQIDQQQEAELLETLSRVAKNIYVIDRSHDALDCLFRFYVDLKRFDECLALCQDALATFGPRGSILDHFAICYENKNQFALANKYFQESLKLAPEHEWAREGLERTERLIAAAIK